jgi:hypothetical protein
MMNDNDRMEVLNRLEAGEINAEEAIEALRQEGDISEGKVCVEENPASPSRWRSRWLIPFSLGIAGTAAGLGLSQLGGWWWACAGPLLVLSVTVVIVAAATSQSPWVHLRVRTGAKDSYRKLNLHLPIPLGLTAWSLRVFGSYIPGLDDIAIDDLLIDLEGNLSSETPIHIEVQNSEEGEQVEVFMG